MLSKLASNIKHLRKLKSLSQEELAKVVGGRLNRGNIASYENGTAEPKICNLLKLSNYYEISIIDLTTVDLRCPLALGSARKNFQYELKEEDKVALAAFFEQAAELKKVMESVRVCQNFKMKCMENVPADLQPIIANFDQLCSAGGMLMKAHTELLDFVKTRVK